MGVWIVRIGSWAGDVDSRGHGGMRSKWVWRDDVATCHREKWLYPSFIRIFLTFISSSSHSNSLVFPVWNIATGKTGIITWNVSKSWRWRTRNQNWWTTAHSASSSFRRGHIDWDSCTQGLYMCAKLYMALPRFRLPRSVSVHILGRACVAHAESKLVGHSLRVKFL